MKFASQSSRKFPFEYMAIYSKEITKIVKLSHQEFPHLVQNRENICTQNIWRIQYPSKNYFNTRLKRHSLPFVNVPVSCWCSSEPFSHSVAVVPQEVSGLGLIHPSGSLCYVSFSSVAVVNVSLWCAGSTAGNPHQNSLDLSWNTKDET